MAARFDEGIPAKLEVETARENGQGSGSQHVDDALPDIRADQSQRSRNRRRHRHVDRHGFAVVDVETHGRFEGRTEGVPEIHQPLVSLILVGVLAELVEHAPDGPLEQLPTFRGGFVET